MLPHRKGFRYPVNYGPRAQNSIKKKLDDGCEQVEDALYGLKWFLERTPVGSGVTEKLDDDLYVLESYNTPFSTPDIVIVFRFDEKRVLVEGIRIDCGDCSCLAFI